MRRLSLWLRLLRRAPFRPWHARVASATVLAGLTLGGASAHASAAPSLLHEKHDFDARGMLRTAPPANGSAGTSFSLAAPGRFSMAQSYSLTAQSGSGGSMSSGLYLNTLSYRLSPHLSASVDVGFHTPLHSSVPGLEQDAGLGGFVLPRMGVEYRPSDRWSLNLELYNGPDAFKAYGGSPGLHSSRGNRVP